MDSAFSRSNPALTKVPEAFLCRGPSQSKPQVAAASISEPSGLLRRLLDGGTQWSPVDWWRISDASGRTDIADEIRAAMTAAGYSVRESDPFVPDQEIGKLTSRSPPIVGRIQSMWESMRGTVLKHYLHRLRDFP